jgi:hypothetical protein
LPGGSAPGRSRRKFANRGLRLHQTALTGSVYRPADDLQCNQLNLFAF